jgi:peroxiredoxin
MPKPSSISAQQPLPRGTPAPPFSLGVAPGKTASLSEYRGAPVVLIFYPADFSPVCGDELGVFNELIPEFRRLGAQVLGISVDQIWCHLAYARERRLRFPLLADFHPKGEVSNAYNAYRAQDGFSERALYLIDPEAKIAWGYISQLDVNPGANEVLEQLEQLVGRTAQQEAPR